MPLVRPIKGTGDGKMSLDKGSTQKVECMASGYSTAAAAIAAVATSGYIPLTAATLYGIVIFNDFTAQDQGAGHWKVTANYVDPTKAEDQKPDEGTYKFRATGQIRMVNRKQALEHIADYAPPGEVAPNHNGAINVQNGKAEGADAPIGEGKITFEFSHPDGVVDEDFSRALTKKLGYTNTDTWHGYAPGELRFDNFDAGDGTDQPATVTYTFDVVENVTGADYGDIAGVDHKGHELITFEFEEDVDGAAKRIIAPPIAAHVERVCHKMSFATFFGF